MIERALEGFCQLLRILVGSLVAALVIPVTMQVLARYTGILPSYLWTEELATFLFVWMVMLGSIIAVWEGTHFDVQVTPDAKSRLGKLLQRGIVLVLLFIFAVLFVYYGIGYAKFGAMQTSTMLQANMLVIYITVPLAGFCWAVFSFFRIWQAVQEYKLDTDITPR
ncbi:TRAP transporter small permease [Granulosicoccus antarcticus]|uniref:TRAP transporter small permease protein n=1 Tax=Granulosicoccus antarcticus IMCC3135 TaxID=1192854 RepID=A0A2Z2P2V6_9GAMM|nr:TRAP transporter small permease subunit [Granulosicoccus antarcticus]ASJ74917.1 hypothetical protein IMCC3135_24245 [Granulosicoccus antarcticus IMCC3135]